MEINKGSLPPIAVSTSQANIKYDSFRGKLASIYGEIVFTGKDSAEKTAALHALLDAAIAVKNFCRKAFET